jgi:hypothetical protein
LTRKILEYRITNEGQYDVILNPSPLVARAYREAMDRFSNLSILDVWYFHVETEKIQALFEIYSQKDAKGTAKILKKARKKTHARTLDKLSQVVRWKAAIYQQPAAACPA